MSLEENKALAHRFFEDAPKNPSACDEIFAPSFRFHALHHLSSNRDMNSTPQIEKDAYERQNVSWGDWRTTIEGIIAADDKVVVWWTQHGTHRGEYYGVPPTGREASWSGVNIFRIADGKIAEIWDMVDHLWIWQQLGVLPTTKDAITRAREVTLTAQR